MIENREAADMLKNIVGPDNFSEDPAIISSYTLVPFAAVVGSSSKDLWDRAKLGAVILPGNTEEAQAIVKVCNRYKINFKASSTGLYSGAIPISKEGSLKIDLRRMNRIIKLDHKNMYAVVEPYVSHLELAVEAQKKGLVCHIIGAGSQTSVVASTTSLSGTGHSGITTGYSGRNCLGAEWILPTGEVVRWGLVEDGKAGHPGPGLMGVCRGYHGAAGSLGIFTKAAVKLYPWPGPAELEITGKNPTLGLKIPDNMKVYLLALPSPEKLAEATYAIADAQIAYHAWYHPLFMHAQRWMGGATSNDDHYEIWKKLEDKNLIDKNLDELTVILAAHSEKEMEYKEKVLKDIIRETGAEEFLSEFVTKDKHTMERFFCAEMIVHKPCTEFRTGAGELSAAWLQHMNLASHLTGKKKIREIQKKYVAQGILTDFGGETCWGGPEEQRPLGHTEFVYLSNPRDPELMEKKRGFESESTEFAIDNKLLGTGVRSLTGETDKTVSMYLGDYFPYKRKIKKAFDPNDVADPYTYLGVPED
jgi:hypothetical protein